MDTYSTQAPCIPQVTIFNHGYQYRYSQGYNSPYHVQQAMADKSFTYPHMDSLVTSISLTFCQELLQYKIPHSAIILNIPKYNGTTYPDEYIDTYRWIITSLQMDKRFICTYYVVTKC